MSNLYFIREKPKVNMREKDEIEPVHGLRQGSETKWRQRQSYESSV